MTERDAPPIEPLAHDAPPLAILVDYDGTIAQTDVGDMLMAELKSDEWEEATARYDAGLASIIEVAEAQGLLVQAEYQDALARVDVWRALLAQALARGNLTPFIDLARSSGAR